MKILFLGFLVPEELTGLLLKDKNPQIAAHKLQSNIVKGLEESSGNALDILGALPVTDYPGFPQLFIKGHTWQREGGGSARLMPFINIIILKHVTRLMSCLFYLFPWLFKHRGQRRTVLVYALHSPYLLAAFIARTFLGGKVVLIVPDMPEYMDVGKQRGLLRGLAKKIDVWMINLMMRLADGLIVINSKIAEDFGQGTPYMVLDAIADIDAIGSEALSGEQDADGRTIVTYAGGLVEEYGIMLLLEAFSLLEGSEYALWIFGRGELEPLIKERAAKDSRISFFGFVDNRTVIEHERKSTVLVNPRRSGRGYLKYSFPSKLLEFMSTGTPVITTRLPGITPEYAEHLFILKEETPEALARLLKDVCGRPGLRAIGQGAVEFVRQNKSPRVQGARLKTFLDSIAD